VIYAQGKRFVLGPGADPAQHFDLTDAEKMLGLDGLARTHIFSGVELVKASGTMNGPDWPATDLMKFDELTARDYLASRGLSEAAVNLLTLGGVSADDFSFDALSRSRDLRSNTPTQNSRR
jgi:hypothetical protein